MVRCQDVNKAINYSVHHGDAGLREAFRYGFPVECFQDGSDAAGLMCSRRTGVEPSLACLRLGPHRSIQGLGG